MARNSEFFGMLSMPSLMVAAAQNFFSTSFAWFMMRCCSMNLVMKMYQVPADMMARRHDDELGNHGAGFPDMGEAVGRGFWPWATSRRRLLPGRRSGGARHRGGGEPAQLARRERRWAISLTEAQSLIMRTMAAAIVARYLKIIFITPLVKFDK